MNTNMDSHKKAMIKALRKSLGVVKTACESLGISRSTHYNWMESDPEYKAEVESIGEEAIDFVESKLMERIDGVTMGKETKDGPVTYELAPDTVACIFFLKTRGKKRGYVEKQEVEHSGELKQIIVEVIDGANKDKSDERLET